MKNKKLHVIAVVSNPVRYKSRWALFKEFERHMNESDDIVLHKVEMAFGDREFQVAGCSDEQTLRLQSWDELWHKENMINLAIQRLPCDWEFVAWIDTDCHFARTDFAKETIERLQHYMVVQMWQNAIDLGPDGQALATHHSFMSQYLSGKPYCYGKGGRYYERWHPGYAWAARREAIDHLGGLIDIAILGAADNHMAHALIGMLDSTMAQGLHPNYTKHLKIWQDRAERYIRRDVGVVPGTIFHGWHGRKRDRKYHERWKILVDHQYDPDKDIKRDHQGLYQLVDHGDVRSIKFRDDLRAYFRARHEDSIDLE